MKRIAIVFVLFCLMTLFSACSTIVMDSGMTESLTENSQEIIATDKYTIFWKDEECYIKSHLSKQHTSDFSKISPMKMFANYPRFSSVSEMIESVRLGNLTDDEISALTKREYETDIGTKLVDLNTLYEAVLPSNLSVEYVELSGLAYRFKFKEANGSLTCLDEESFNYYFDTIFQNPVGVRTLISQETDQDRNAMITYSQHSNGTVYKTVNYAISSGNNSLYISELYYTKDLQDNTTTDVLTRLDIYGKKGTQLFYVYFANLENSNLIESYSTEWLSAFGLREYVGTEMS